MPDSAPSLKKETNSRREGFPRRIRLLAAREYQRVFAQPERSSDAFLNVIARSNDQGYARLGLAISRKVAPRACQRNRIKRLIRESFRVEASQLPGIGIVVMARSSAVQCSNDEIRASFKRHIQKLVGLCAKS